MDRGAWWATVHGVAKELDRTERLSTHTHTHRAQIGLGYGKNAKYARNFQCAQVTLFCSIGTNFEITPDCQILGELE